MVEDPSTCPLVGLLPVLSEVGGVVDLWLFKLIPQHPCQEQKPSRKEFDRAKQLRLPVGKEGALLVADKNKAAPNAVEDYDCADQQEAGPKGEAQYQVLPIQVVQISSDKRGIFLLHFCVSFEDVRRSSQSPLNRHNMD